MEEILINAYRKFQKEYDKNNESNFTKLDFIVFVPALIAVVSTVSFLISTFVLPLSLWYWISVGMMALSYAAFEYATENVKIKRSYEEFVKYCEYCADLKDCLAVYSVDSKEKVIIIQERISGIISDLMKTCENRFGYIEKVLQVFATPIAIAIITAVIAGNDRTDDKMMIAALIIIIFVLVWKISNAVAKFRNYKHRKEIEELDCFVYDLQGIIDTQFEGGIAYQEEKSRTEREECY